VTPLTHNLSLKAFGAYPLTSGSLYKGMVTPLQPMIDGDGACIRGDLEKELHTDCMDE
jgi:hypothetical protein